MKPYNPPIHLATMSLVDHTRKTLLENGFKEVNPDEFVKTEGTTRTTWTRIHDAWTCSVEMLVGGVIKDFVDTIVDDLPEEN